MTFDDLIDARISSRIKELVAAMQTEKTFHDILQKSAVIE